LRLLILIIFIVFLVFPIFCVSSGLLEYVYNDKNEQMAYKVSFICRANNIVFYKEIIIYKDYFLKKTELFHDIPSIDQYEKRNLIFYLKIFFNVFLGNNKILMYRYFNLEVGTAEQSNKFYIFYDRKKKEMLARYNNKYYLARDVFNIIDKKYKKKYVTTLLSIAFSLDKLEYSLLLKFTDFPKYNIKVYSKIMDMPYCNYLKNFKMECNQCKKFIY